jgi:hypothetical protein
MTDIIKEEHKEIGSHIFPKPDTYVHGNIYGSKVHFEQSVEEGENIKFIVKVEAEQLINNNTQSLCIFNSLSEYDLSISKEELSKHENWYPLVQKSVVECNKLYQKKVKETYLEGTDIPPLTE